MNFELRAQNNAITEYDFADLSIVGRSVKSSILAIISISSQNPEYNITYEVFWTLIPHFDIPACISMPLEQHVRVGFNVI